MKISILHATYFREKGPEEVRSAWLEAATNPERVEYRVAVTRTDTLALSETDASSRVIVEPPEGTSTTVRNWNSLAITATGDFLFVIADDLFPVKRGWDSDLEKIARMHDPCRNSYLVKVADSTSKSDTKVRHPVASRRFYEKYGLWWPGYSGMYVDSDLTLFAFWRAAIIDGRHIRFNHINPIVDNEFEASLSFSEANSESEYTRGKLIFNQRWPRFLQGTRVSLVDTNVSLLHVASLKLKVSEAFSIVFRSRFLNWLR